MRQFQRTILWALALLLTIAGGGQTTKPVFAQEPPADALHCGPINTFEGDLVSLNVGNVGRPPQAPGVVQLRLLDPERQSAPRAVADAGAWTVARGDAALATRGARERRGPPRLRTRRSAVARDDAGPGADGDARADLWTELRVLRSDGTPGTRLARGRWPRSAGP